MKWVKLICFLLVVWVGVPSYAQSDDCSQSDYQALINLYNATAGWNWTNTWDFSQPMDNWYGVEVTNGCVTGLSLNNNNLQGSIPSTIGNLSALQLLDLSNNQLSGAIPSSIGQLNQLRELYLYQNDLSGNLPDAIGDLSFLLVLDLQSNQLSGIIPNAITNLQQLNTLVLRRNRLVGPVPNSIGTLSNLVLLDLSHNSFWNSLPSSLSDLTNLSHLILNNNLFTGTLPENFDQLQKLETLLLSNNDLFSLFPTELMRISSLNWIALDNNTFYGRLPEDWSNLSNLSVLHLQGNFLWDGLPEDLANLSQLQDIDFRNNLLSGCFPLAYRNFCFASVDFSGNADLPGGGNFENFCIDLTGSCEPTPPTNTEPTADTSCLSFDVTGGTDNCAAPNSFGVSIRNGNPKEYLISVEGTISGSVSTCCDSTFNIRGLPVGNYTVTITDANDCSASQEITISDSCLADAPASTSRNNTTTLYLSDFELSAPNIQVEASFPNPFQYGTTLPIHLSVASDLEIVIFTSTGKQVYQTRQTYDVGTHLISFQEELFPESGMYLYRIQKGTQTISGKMIKQQ